MTNVHVVTAPRPPIYVGYEDLHMQAPVHSATADCAEETGGGQEFISLVGDNTYLVLPIAACPYPTLQFQSYLWWVIVANYTEDGAALTQTLDLQLMVDGVATGSVITTSAIPNFPGAGNGTVRIEGKLIVLGSMNGANEQFLELDILVLDNTGAVAISEKKYQRYTITQTVDHDIGFKIRKTVAAPVGMTTNTLDVRSINCMHVNRRSGS